MEFVIDALNKVQINTMDMGPTLFIYLFLRGFCAMTRVKH